jgi:hypothetical protein
VIIARDLDSNRAAYEDDPVWKVERATESN